MPHDDGANTTVFDGLGSPVIIGAFVEVEADASLKLKGTIDLDNGGINGTIAVDDSNGSSADLVISGTVALYGSGAVTLEGTGDEITGTHRGVLDNYSSIDGTGQIGNGGTPTWSGQRGERYDQCHGWGAGPLVIDTGTAEVINKGLLEATGGGELDVQDDKIHNVGTGANGIMVDGASTLLVDTGTLKLTGGGDVTLESGSLLTENAHSSLLTVNSGDLLFLDLDNVNNTIEGAGAIGTGDGHFKLENQAAATINADVGGQTLTIDTGNTIFNKGTLAATNGGTLDIQDSAIDNHTGTGAHGIVVDGASTLLVDTGTLKLTGGGDVTLESGGQITESPPVNTGEILHLDNIDNTIEGAGAIGTGDVHFKLENQAAATIDANVIGQTLTIDTGKPILNNGTLEATNGGTLIVDDAVKGSGTVAISGGGTADFHSSFDENVAFSGAGTLALAQPFRYHSTTQSRDWSPATLSI